MLERQRRRATPSFRSRAQIAAQRVIADVQNPACCSFVSPAALEDELRIAGSPRSKGITALQRRPEDFGELSSDLRRQVVQFDDRVPFGEGDRVSARV